MTLDFLKYEQGKQNITIIINIILLVGFSLEFYLSRHLYSNFQFIFQSFSTAVFVITLILILINKKKYYGISFLIFTYFLLSNLVIYDYLFPEFKNKLKFLPSEFFSRNMFFTFPFIAFAGFIINKRHIIILGAILVIYITSQLVSSSNEFIQASAVNYYLTTVGFCWVMYFLVNKNSRFIKELEESRRTLKETQQSLIQSEKMASLGTLTAGIAHEINNPLNFIQGGVYGLENHLEDQNQSAENMQLYIDSIKLGIERVSDIVKGLNQFNRNTKVYNEPCDIHSIIDQSLTMLQGSIKSKIEILKNYTAENFIILGNVGRMHQVFLNIIKNSCQSISGMGTIKINTETDGKYLRVIITDNGCGINEEIISRITEPFFTTKEPGAGTGLGLSIVYSIIKDHNGEINFSSQINNGTTVTIKLPNSIPNE